MKPTSSSRTAPLLAIALGLLACAGLSFQALRAAPVRIDDFDENLSPQTNVDAFVPGSMLGGEADYDILGVGPVETGIYSIDSGVLDADLDHIHLTLEVVYDGVDGNTNWEFDGLPDVDLTGGGTNEGFEIEVLSVTGEVNLEIQIWESSGALALTKNNVSAGVLKFPFADFSAMGTADPASAGMVLLRMSVGSSGGSVRIGSFWAGNRPPDAPPAANAPDKERPKLTIQGKPQLRKARPRHTIRGRARDNDALKKVQVRPRGQGWRKVTLRNSGKWAFRTPRLRTRSNDFKFRAIDASRNRSQVRKANARGVSPRPRPRKRNKPRRPRG